MIENLSFETIKAIFEALPGEVSFVDEGDRVRFFNKAMNRIFPRPETILGRKVQDCHPEKSLPMVNCILEKFKNGSREKATFWIDVSGRKIYIRYIPVLGKKGQYLGCLEVAEDVTDIQEMEGEKRVLDE